MRNRASATGEGEWRSAPMMRLPRFRYFAPTCVKEAVAHPGGRGPRRRVRRGRDRPLPEHEAAPADAEDRHRPLAHRGAARACASGAGGAVRSAPRVPLSDDRAHRRIRRDYPGLAHAIAEISTPLLRNMGTIGGNVLLDTRCNYYDQNLRVAAGDRLLHEEGRRDLLGGARLADAAWPSSRPTRCRS